MGDLIGLNDADFNGIQLVLLKKKKDHKKAEHQLSSLLIKVNV